MADQTLPKNMDDLLADIEREWNALMQVIERLTPEQMTTPDSGGWSPKDNLAHLSTWMNFMLKSYLEGQPAHVVMGMDGKKFKELDEDGINAVIFERNRRRSSKDILDEVKNTHAETLKMLNAMSFSDLMKPLRADDPEKRPVIGWVIGNTSEHFAEHRGYIERAFGVKK